MIPVTESELSAALATWMAVAPQKHANQLRKQIELSLTKRHDGDPIPPYRNALADHCAAKLVQAGWVVTKPVRKAPGE